MTSFKRNDLVVYDLEPTQAGLPVTVEARVRRLHRDGMVTVEAGFMYTAGQRVPGYLGFKYRMHAEDLRAA